MKASIGIFHKSVEQTQNSPQQEVPDEVFEAAIHVQETKGCEYVKTTGGTYVVKYNEHGPFEGKVNDEWYPVYIMKPIKWISGGIKQIQLQQLLDKKHETV